jgi:hypothetical protein
MISVKRKKSYVFDIKCKIIVFRMITIIFFVRFCHILYDILHDVMFYDITYDIVHDIILTLNIISCDII